MENNGTTTTTTTEQRVREIAPHLMETYRRQRIVVRQNDRREWEAVLYLGSIEGARAVGGRATREEVVAAVRHQLETGMLLGTLAE